MPITITETNHVRRTSAPAAVALLHRSDGRWAAVALLHRSDGRWAVVDLFAEDGTVTRVSDLELMDSITWRTEARARAELRHLTAQEGPCTTTEIFEACAACATSTSPPATSSPKRRRRGRR